MWWLARAEANASSSGEGYGHVLAAAADDQLVRERATTASSFDPVEIRHGRRSEQGPTILVAVIPLIMVILVNLSMSMLVLPRLDTSFLAAARWGAKTLSAVSGIWSVSVALISACVILVALNFKRLKSQRITVDAGANASTLPVLSVSSLVGFGAVVEAMPAFDIVSEAVLSIEGGPLVSLALSTNILAALTGSASGGMAISLDALGETYMHIAAGMSIDPALLHRVAVISAGTLDSLPHNGAVVTLLALCGSSHQKSYFDIVMVAIVGALLALMAVIVLGSRFGSF
jgi:H+/gluconate symporter-like permease